MLITGDSSSRVRPTQQETVASSGRVRHAHLLPAQSVSRRPVLNQSATHTDKELAFESAVKQSSSPGCSPCNLAIRGKETQLKSKIRARELTNIVVFEGGLRESNGARRHRVNLSPRRSGCTEEWSPFEAKGAKLSETDTAVTTLTSLPSSYLGQNPYEITVSPCMSQDAASVHSDLTGLTGCFQESNSPIYLRKRSALKVTLSSLVESTPLNVMTTRPKKSVAFDSISVRPYERILTVNPSCSSGPPIGLGWKFGQESVYSLDTFEERRSPHRRSKSQMVLPRETREEMLLEIGYDRRALAYGVRQVIKVKNQRRRTVVNLGNAAFEEKVESAKNGVKRLFVARK